MIEGGLSVSDADVDHDPFAGPALDRIVPSTEAQREVWLASHLSREASLAYNESVTLRLTGRLDPAALQAAVDGVVARHESLRATFGPDGTTMCVAGAQPVPIAASDLRGFEPAAQSLAIERLLHDAVEHAFDLERGPLLQVRQVALSAELHLVVLTVHHIVCDGWSFGVIIRDLGHLYAQHLAAARGEAVASHSTAAASFADYALAQAAHEHSAAGRADVDHWLRRFAAVPAPLELPIDRPRRARRSFASKRADFVLDATLVDRLRRLAARDGASLYSMLLGGFAALLHRLGGGDDLVIGVPMAGQSEPGFGEVVGHCVNLLPLRVPVQPTQSARDTARAAQAAMLDAFEHQRFTYGTLLKKLVLPRDPARLPLVSVMFNLDQAFDTGGPGFPGLTLDVKGNARTHENFELFVNAVQEGGALRLECQFNSDLFDEQSVRRWIGGYELLLRGASEMPDRPLGELDVVVPADRALLAQWNATARPFPRALGVHELIEAQVARTPERIALVSGAASLSYRELDQRAALIADALRTRGVGTGARVGLCAGRSAGMLAAMLGVLKAGAAYVPLDPSYPADRISHMVDDADLALLITEPAYAAQFGWPAARCLLLHDSGAPVEPIDPASLPATHAPVPAESPAYVIYTSGSTGKPKGVVVPHRAVVNFLTSMAQQPGLDGGDTLLAVTTLSFDIAVTELLLPLTVGARIVLATRDDAIDPARLRELIETHRASVMQATPSTWRMLVDADWRGGPEFKALCGGEPLGADLARELGLRTGSLWNMYGPTETTVWSTLSAIVTGAPSIDIGVPIANTSVWILDERAALCPVGVPGEIVIGGDGVTLGYLHRPELTADRFIADPFSGLPHSLMYRTGDRGRWRADGRLEHLGRLDHQVKVRGFRIEPGEIEAAVLADPQLARCVVIAREDRPGDVRLVAYLVARDAQPIDEASLRSRLKQTLPDYMLPQHLVGLPAIPLLPNGKVDRKALPLPAAAATVARRHVPPRNRTEQLVASAMEAALNLPELGAEDNFFALGGHSLLAAQLAASLASTTGRHVPMSAVFEAPTIAELAAWVDASGEGPGPADSSAAAPPAGGNADEAPASLMQQRVWFLEQLRPGTSTYNTPSGHRLSGPLDVAVLERAFNAIIERQAVLRTALVRRDLDLVQQIAPALTVSLQPVHELCAVDPGQRELELLELLQVRASEPMPTDTAPLFRVALYRLAPEEHVLFFMPHHLIWDGWSFDIFYAEMAAFYAAFSHGVPPDLPALTWRYGDFSRWQQQWLEGPDAQRQLAYWCERFAMLPEPLALPLDKPRPAQMSGAGETRPIAWPVSLAEQARAFGAARGATLFMTLLAMFAVLLHRTTGQRDIVVGTPFRGRHRPEVEPVMGFFVNALPLRLTVDPDQGFATLLDQVRVVVLEAFAAPDVPIERLVQALKLPRDESRTPLYQAFFSFQDARDRQRDWGPLRQTQMHVFQKGAAEDLGVWLLDHGNGLAGGLTFATDLLFPVTADRTIARLGQLAKASLGEPERALRELEFLVPEERRLLADWNATGDRRPAAAGSVAALLRAQAIRCPGRVALRCGERRLSYQALDQQAAGVAHRLQAAGIGPGARVGIRLPRSVDLVVAVLGVLKAGAAYLPLPAVALAVHAAELGDLALTIDTRWWAAPQAGSAAPAESPADMQVDTRPDAAAFVAFARSGVESADGALISQGALLNLIASLADSPGVTEADRWVAVSPFETDMAAVEILLPLAVGAELVLATADDLRSGATLRTLLEACAPTAMQTTPAACQALLDAGWRGAPGFKLLVGGEPLSPASARALTAVCDSVWHLTGQPQTGVWSACARLLPASLGGSVVPAGRPIRNTEVLILDALGNECPIGVVGEIWIAGDGLAIGSLGSPAGADARFACPRARPSQRFCRSGEAGRWSADGALEWLGLAVHASAAARAPRLTAPPPKQAIVEPRMNDAQQKVAALWQEVLGTPDIGPADNFFDLGGHSLLAMRVVSQMQSRLGLVVPLRRLIYESLAQIAATPSTPIDTTVASPAEAPAGGLLTRVFGRFGRRT